MRSISGLERKAVIQQFEKFLRYKRLISKQIGFIEQMIEFYTDKDHLNETVLLHEIFNFRVSTLDNEQEWGVMAHTILEESKTTKPS